MKTLLALTMLAATFAGANPAQTGRDPGEYFNLPGNVAPANDVLANDPSPGGFVAPGPRFSNPCEYTPDALASSRGFLEPSGGGGQGWMVGSGMETPLMLTPTTIVTEGKLG